MLYNTVNDRMDTVFWNHTLHPSKRPLPVTIVSVSFNLPLPTDIFLCCASGEQSFHSAFTVLSLSLHVIFFFFVTYNLSILMISGKDDFVA